MPNSEMHLTKIKTHACSRYHLRGMANWSIARSFTLLCSFQIKMAFIAERTWESTVAIVISTNLKGWNPGQASKQADIEVKGHIILCTYTRNAPNSGQQNSMRLITNMRNTSNNEKIRYYICYYIGCVSTVPAPVLKI